MVWMRNDLVVKVQDLTIGWKGSNPAKSLGRTDITVFPIVRLNNEHATEGFTPLTFDQGGEGRKPNSVLEHWDKAYLKYQGFVVGYPAASIPALDSMAYHSALSVYIVLDMTPIIFDMVESVNKPYQTSFACNPLALSELNSTTIQCSLTLNTVTGEIREDWSPALECPG